MLSRMFLRCCFVDDFTVDSVDRLGPADVKCINIFFRYSMFYSVISVLTELGLGYVT